MRGFQANNCRLCPKVFCCHKCRLKHETTFHKIFPDCDICIYGNFFLENIDDCFLKHLESSHLPVHCIRCKKVFGSVEELLQHKKCNYSHAKELSPKTPFRTTPAVVIAVDDHDSPILLESQRQDYLNYILVTSTPMQRGEEPNQMFEKGKEVITPVDKPSRIANKSIIKKIDSAKSDDNSKRRVTFGETPGIPPGKKIRTILPENQELLSGNEILESLEVSSNQNVNGNSTSDLGMSKEQFYNAKTKTAQCKSGKTDLSLSLSKEEGNKKNVYEASTPDSGMSTRQFYSAKTDLSSKPSNASNTTNVEGFTPDSGMSTGHFYSAKSELTSKQSREERKLEERSTPVGIPTRKLINTKGDIYRKQNQPMTRSLDITTDDVGNQDNLNEISMELCTPAKNLNSPEEKTPIESDTCRKDEKLESNDDSSITENILGTSHTNVIDFYTPAKTSNPGKITVNGDIYEENTNSPIVETSKENEGDDKSLEEITSEDNQETNQAENADATGHKTLWLSATNLEEMNESKIQNEENIDPEKPNQPTMEENTPEKTPESPVKKRVSIVMPTPILKTTNVKMKFHFPAHLSSTPIMSSGAIKIKQTKIVKDLSTKVIQQQKHQTPFKTPQGRLCEMLQRKFGDGSLRRNLAIMPDNPSCSSSDNKQIVPLETVNDIYSCSDTAVCKNEIQKPINTQYEDPYSSISCEPETSVSVSSMTESNIWTSMTRIVKSVLGGFTSMSQDSSNMCIDKTSTSYKRQLSDSETGDFLEAPCLKRFKFTDIKCRRAIRDLPALELRRSVPAPASSLARIEIVKSVSTLYAPQTMRIHCDKATQTDNYLMYGWHPQV